MDTPIYERFSEHPDRLPSVHCLWCDTAGQSRRFSFSSEKLISTVSTPIQCLVKAVELIPDLIVIRFGRIPIKERNALVELSAALKRNRCTRKCSLLALLPSTHRKLLEDLERTGVEFVRYTGDIRPGSIQMREIVEGLGPDDRLTRQLKRICPYLHYRKVDSRRELTVCGAYRDRMVLGGLRLQKTCETEEHRQCEYFQNPRAKS